jgi:hypothetical protein
MTAVSTQRQRLRSLVARRATVSGPSGTLFQASESLQPSVISKDVLLVFAWQLRGRDLHSGLGALATHLHSLRLWLQAVK